MKKRKLNQFYGLRIICLAVMLCFSRCETSEDIRTLNQEITLSSRTTEKIAFNDLPLNLTHNIKSLRTISSSGRDGDGESMMLDEGRVVKVTDMSRNTKYSIKFTIPNQPGNVLYNLVLGTDDKNQETAPFIMKYTIDNMEEVYATGRADFSKMKGKIAQYDYDSFQSYLEDLSNLAGRAETDTIEPDPCSEHSNNDDNNDGQGDGTSDGSQSGSGTTGGGGGGSGETGGNNGTGDYGGSGSEFENTDDTSSSDDGDTADCNINVWSNGETGEVFGISWSCSDGSAGSYTWGRTADPECPGDGDVGINDGEDGPSCKSFNYTNTAANWQEAAVINIKFNVYLYDQNRVRYLYTMLYSQPILFGAPSNLANGGDLPAGVAAEASAIALRDAIRETVHEFRNTSVSETAVDLFFRDKLKEEFSYRLPGSRVQFNSTTSLIPTPYITYAIIPDNCN